MSGGLISVGDSLIVNFNHGQRPAVVVKIVGMSILCAINEGVGESPESWKQYWIEPYQIVQTRRTQ